MKRILSLLLALLIALFAVGCGTEDVLSGLDEAIGYLEDIEQLDSYENISGENDEQSESGENASDEDIEQPQSDQNTSDEDADQMLPEDGSYTTAEDVALYIHIYGHLPSNFITKNEARDLGWEGGGLEPYAPGKCIGGDRFGNYEGLLPEKDGRSYTECDIDTLGKDSRGAKRIVFSNDGLIYYTDDHYESFELLYGEE